MAGLLIPALDAPAAAACDQVAEALRVWASEPFDDVTANCGLSVLAYAERATGSPPLVRPRALTRRDVRRMMTQPHVFEAYCGEIMANLGIATTRSPERGDVGLIDLDTGLTAAICLGGGLWASRGARAVVMQPAAFRAAWRVACRKP